MKKYIHDKYLIYFAQHHKVGFQKRINSAESTKTQGWFHQYFDP